MNDDFVGVMLKIAFGDESNVYPNDYLQRLKKREWKFWGTPRKCQELVGRGRMLLLYDPNLKAITAEVEIAKVRKVKVPHKYKWRNTFVPGTLNVFQKPISLEEIRSVEGFRKVGVPGDRPPYRNVTRAQYLSLLGSVGAKVRLREARAHFSGTAEFEEDGLSDLNDAPPGKLAPDRAATSGVRVIRDSKVREYVLRNAEGKCEYCGERGFQMKSARPYLEAHHIILLSKDGRDTVDNVIALCPNHHREAHFGAEAETLEEKFIVRIKARSKRPNKAPEPTPGAGTPRATERASK